MLAIRFVAPLADGIGGGGGQEGVSREDSNRSDGPVFGDQDFEDHFTGAVGGQGSGGVLRLDAIAQTNFGLIGSEPDIRGERDPGALRCVQHRGRAFFAGGGLHAENDLTVIVDHQLIRARSGNGSWG